MAQIIVNPRLMQAFAEELAQLSGRMQEWDAQLDRERRALRTVWDDRRYREFNAMVEHAAEQLRIFHDQARLYVIYLNKKAEGAQRYLRRRS